MNVSLQFITTAMQSQNHPKNKPERYSIFRNPLFTQPPPPAFQHLPFHITLSTNSCAQCVIDHRINNILINEGKKRDDCLRSSKRIFSQIKRDSTKSCNMSMNELASKMSNSIEREPRKHNIFGEHSIKHSKHNQKNQKPMITHEQIVLNLTKKSAHIQQKSKKKQPKHSQPPPKNDLYKVCSTASVKNLQSPLNPAQFAKILLANKANKMVKHDKHNKRQEVIANLLRLATLSKDTYTY